MKKKKKKKKKKSPPRNGPVTTTPFDSALGPVSRKSRNFSGVFRVTQFSLYLQNEGVSRHETLQLFLFLFPLQLMKRPALQNKQVVVLRLAFRARKVLGTFEKRAPGFPKIQVEDYCDIKRCLRSIPQIHKDQKDSKVNPTNQLQK